MWHGASVTASNISPHQQIWGSTKNPRYGLSNSPNPWKAHWVQVLKTSAATRRIPIIVFGPHVQEARLNQARSLGVEAVLTRGTFSKRMGEILGKYTRRIPIEALASSCDAPLSDKARQGIELHNRGEYHDAHEWLEEAWMEIGDPEGYLYRALLQFTIIHLHLSKDNLRGARKMLLRVHQWLDPLPPLCRGVDVATLKANVESLRDALTFEPARFELRPFQIQLVS